MTTTILVIGGTGMLGKPVVQHLLADRFQVRLLTRTPASVDATLSTVCDVVAGDVEEESSIEQALRGCVGVHINLNGGADPDLEYRGTSLVAQVAARTNIQRITYLSGTTVCEEHRWFAGTDAKYRAEAAIRESSVPYTIFRATFFMESLPRYVQGSRASIIGTQPLPYHWVAAADYARMVSSAYANPAAAHKTLYVHGPQKYTLEEALKHYCSVLHPQSRVSHLPFWAATLIAKLFAQKELEAALPFFRYTEKVHEAGDPTEANDMLGQPNTTLEQWCQQQTV